MGRAAEVAMQLGVTFPVTEIGADPVAIRDFAQGVEALGFRHLNVYDHVLGADTTHRDPASYPYTHETLFHEALVLLGFLAGQTQRLEMATHVLVAPQRQTVLVAKQVAEVDILCGGRLRLGIGTGWNPVEYESLGVDFKDRGDRLDEQVAVLRALWTAPVVTFEGRYHRITEAGINPLPVQQPVPIWFGGAGERVYRRVGELGDGWVPFSRWDTVIQEARAGLERIHHYARAAGRDPSSLGLDGRVWAARGTPDDWRERRDGWAGLGCTHLSVNTTRGGFTSPDQHLAALRRFVSEVGLGA